MGSDRPLTTALVIGAGIAGIQAALDIAESGYPVILVDREPSIGGRMLQLSETFPTLDCAQCILTPRTVQAGHHDGIQLMMFSEVVSIQGEIGAFQATIRRKAGGVDWEKCTGCGLCQEKCPKRVASPFDRNTGRRKAIYTLSPQAVPNKPIIDREACLWYTQGKCRVCERFCPVAAIDFDQQDVLVEVETGAIVMATGYDLYGLDKLGEYGYGQVPDVIDGLAMERLLSASGPTAGKVLRPSDGRLVKEVAFVQCAGSRAPETAMPYCSKVCCMYTAKQAVLYKHRVHDGQAYVFYIDVRAAGKRYEEFYHRAAEEDRVLYLRGKVSRVFREGDKVVVWGADTLSGKPVEVAVDMVVLATAMIPSQATRELGAMLGVPSDAYGFLLPVDDNMDPLGTLKPGVFLAGACTGPKDIPETVSQASGAAARVLSLFARWRGVPDEMAALVAADAAIVPVPESP